MGRRDLRRPARRSPRPAHGRQAVGPRRVPRPPHRPVHAARGHHRHGGAPPPPGHGREDGRRPHPRVHDRRLRPSATPRIRRHDHRIHRRHPDGRPPRADRGGRRLSAVVVGRCPPPPSRTPSRPSPRTRHARSPQSSSRPSITASTRHDAPPATARHRRRRRVPLRPWPAPSCHTPRHRRRGRATPEGPRASPPPTSGRVARTRQPRTERNTPP